MQKIVANEELSQQDGMPKVIALDGKKHRGAQDQDLHLVSAFDTKSGLTLGQEKVKTKSNEITAMPILLDSLVIEGHIVSIDAMGCQREIAEKIRSKKADYLLAVKGNQGNLLEEIEDYFNNAECLKNCNVATRLDKGHGRIETRTCYTTDDIDWLDQKSAWKDLRSIVMIVSKRKIKGIETIEKRFFIASLDADAGKILLASRAHWGIENSLHWVLDVVFSEDDRIIWNNNIAQNESIVRRIALNLLKKYRLTRPTKSVNSEKIAIKTLRKVMILDDNGMLKLLREGI